MIDGRQAQAERIVGFIEADFNVAVHSAPGAGKTWMADRISERLTVKRVVRRFDLSVENSGQSILNALRADTGPAHHESIYESYRLLRAELEAAGKPTVIILDEFDSVLRYADGLDFLKLLREVIHRPWKTSVTAFILSRRPLEAIEAQVRGISTLATLCQQEHLGPVVATDLRDLWPQGEELSDVEVTACLSWSTGYAPLVRYWLAARPDRNPSAAAEAEQVVQFQRLLDHLDGMGLRDAAAQLVLGPVLDDWILERRQLEILGVIPRDDDDLCFGSHSIFRDCLRHRTWTLDPWGSLGLAEVRMRGLIDSVLAEAYGAEWIHSDRLKGSKAVQRAYVAAVEKQSVDHRRFGRAGSWLAYTYPQELGDLIMATWDRFEPVFTDGDKALWRTRFDTLATYRTPVAHNRAEVLSPAQRAQCRIYADEVLRAIDRYTDPDD